METVITISEFPNGGKAIVEQLLASEEKSKSKIAWLWESQSEIWVGMLTVWVKSFYNNVHQVCQVHHNRLASLYDGHYSPPKTETLAGGLIERTSSMLDEIESSTG